MVAILGGMSPAPAALPSPPRALAVVCTVWAAGFSLQRILQHASFQTNAFDLSVFDYMLWSTTRGDLLTQPFYGGWSTHLGWHFSPILLLWAPLYRITDAPQVLLLSHVAFGVAFAWSVFAVARERLASEWAAALVASSTLLYKPWLDALVYDFHPELLFPPLVLIAYRAAVQKPSPWLFWTAAVVVLTIKEDAALYLAGFGLLLAWRHRLVRRPALGLVALCIAWLTLVLAVVQPAIRDAWDLGGTSPFVELWGGLGTSLPEVAAAFLTRPLQVLSRIDPRVTGGALVSMLLPLLLLPIGSRWILGVLPPLLVLATADSPVMKGLGLHYAAWLVPFLYLGTVGSLARLQRQKWPRLRSRPATVLAALLLVGCFAGTRWNLLRPSRYAALAHREAVAAALDLIPPDASVAAQSALLPHVPKRREIWMLPSVGDAEFILALPPVNPWPQSDAQLREQLAALTAEYQRVPTPGDVVLLRHR